jgi:hypothetical protein
MCKYQKIFFISGVLSGLAVKIEFTITTNEQASELLQDKVALCLFVANTALRKIPTKLAFSDKIKRFEFEIQAEIFLHFMRGARDALLQTINDKLLGGRLSPDKVRLNDVLNVLRSNKSAGDTKSDKILSLLENCTQEPKYDNKMQKWVRDKSWLFEINAMRDQIAHRNITGRALTAGVESMQFAKAEMIVYLKKENVNGIEIETTIKESNPYAYFNMCYHKFVTLKDQIMCILV